MRGFLRAKLFDIIGDLPEAGMAERCGNSGDLVRHDADVVAGAGRIAARFKAHPARGEDIESFASRHAEHLLGAGERVIGVLAGPDSDGCHATSCPFFVRFSGGVVADWIARSRMRVGLVGERKALRAGSPTRTCGTGRRSEA